MSYQKVKQQTNSNKNFSEILDGCRNLAIALGKEKRIRVKYEPKNPTSSFDMESFQITLSLESYPEFVRTHPRLFLKVLHGDLSHEVGHLILTRPNWEYYNNLATKIKRQRGFYKLMHEIINIVEDSRINHFIILRYRFDVGKRLLLANLILKDMMDNEMEEKKFIANFQMQSQVSSILQGANVGEVIQLGAGESLDMTVDSKGHTQTTGTAPHVKVESGKQEGVYMVAILCNQGLYEAKCTQLWKQLSPEAKADCEKALKVLNGVKYKRVKLDLIRDCQTIYDLVAKHLQVDYTTKEYVCSRRGGNIKGTISDKLKQLLEAEEAKEEKEKNEKKQKEDLAKGSGAGEGSIHSNSLVYAKLNGKLWYGTISELEQQQYEKLEVLTSESYKDKTNWKSWKNKNRVFHKIVWKEAKLINHGEAMLYRIILKSGKEIIATANHNLFTEKWEHSDLQMIRTDKLKVGTRIAIPSILPIETEDYSFGYSHINDDYIYLIGLWLADGNYGSRCVEISLNSETDKDVIERLEQFAKRIKVGFGKHPKKGTKGVTIRLFSVEFMGKLYALGCDYPKQIPNWVFLCSNKQIKAFLEGYADGDGSLQSDGDTRISCVDRTILEGLQTLYLRLGIFTHLSFKRAKGKGHKGIGTYCLETVLRGYPEITFRKVRSIEPYGIGQIYDFSVPETEKFIANNILLHNTGEEIPAPEPNFEAYASLLDECKPEISQLLNQLKKLMKPRVQREIFQKRGRMMSPIVPRIYTNSFRGTVKNVYLRTTAKMEKEQVCIQFDFDFSGSVDKHEAEKITTVLNEVFGHYVDDYGYGITCFGADTQKVKTPFETFQNTRARIGGISVNSAGTELKVAMEANLKMFNSVRGERRKILVIASDFSLSDESECSELLQHFAKAGIEVCLIGFCNCSNVDTIWDNIKGLKVKRTEIKELSELPSRFLDIYLGVQTAKGQ